MKAFMACIDRPRALHSFPTRRSSDLSEELGQVARELVLGDRGAGPGLHLDEPRPATEGLNLGQILPAAPSEHVDRKSTRLNSSHSQISYAVFCLKKKNGR